jgi:hypothetical protein
MRQQMFNTTSCRSGRSFDYRDIFSGLSNEKMSPAACLFVSYHLLHYPSACLSRITVSGAVQNCLFLTTPSRILSPYTYASSFGETLLCLGKARCLLMGQSLVRMKTNFAKKPKNPV